MKVLWDTTTSAADADTIKQIVSISDVLRRYTGREPRHNRCDCPFCTGARPDTFVIIPDKNRYHCHRCGASGDIFDFVGALYDGLKFADSVQRIAVDFGLDNASEDVQRAADAARSLARERQQRQDEALRAYHSALDRYVALDRWSRLPPCDPRYVISVRGLAKAKYLLDSAEDNLIRQ